VAICSSFDLSKLISLINHKTIFKKRNRRQTRGKVCKLVLHLQMREEIWRARRVSEQTLLKI